MVSWLLTAALFVFLIGVGNHALAKHHDQRRDNACQCVICSNKPGIHNCMAKKCVRRDAPRGKSKQ